MFNVANAKRFISDFLIYILFILSFFSTVGNLVLSQVLFFSSVSDSQSVFKLELKSFSFVFLKVL